MLQRQAGARNHQPGVALGNGHRNARRDDASLPRAKLDVLTGDEIEAGVTRIGALRQRRVVAQAGDGKLDHGPVARDGVAHEERRQASQLPLGQPCADEDTVGAILAELDRRPEGVERRDHVAALVRHEELHDLEPGPRTARQFERGAPRGLRRTPPRPGASPGSGSSSRSRASPSTPVDLVEHELDRQLAGTDLGEHRLDGLHHLVELGVVRGRVGDVQDEIGDERLLERRREALDELVRQPPDEADGVGQEVAAALVLERPRGRVERLEEPVVDRGLGPGERVEQRGLADVRVAGEGDGRRLGAHARLPALHHAVWTARGDGP